MKRRSGSPPLYLASPVTEKTRVTGSEEQFKIIAATLEQCRADLVGNGDRETAQLVSVAVLQLRMKLHRIQDAELKALCDALIPDDPADLQQGPKMPGQRRRPSAQLKLVE